MPTLAHGPVILLEQFGVLRVIGEDRVDPRHGKFVKVRCVLCKGDDERALAKLRTERKRGTRPRCIHCKATTMPRAPRFA